ncbi:MAG: putative lipid II flippase FtsW [Clostridiales bacterium]|nr:putative lipid II flippase FtsW [Clostridiales bacterium]
MKKPRKTKTQTPTIKLHQGRIDFSILLAVTLLCAFGLVMVFSASYYYAQRTRTTNYDPYFFLSKQVVFLIIGYFVMLVLSRMDYKIIQRVHWPIYLVSVLLLILVLFIGVELNGGRRWILIAGVQIQPSEIAKFGMMIFMCAFMSKNRGKMHEFRGGMLPMLFVIGAVAGLVILQPNMSMAVIIAMIGVILLFLGGADFKQLVILGIVGLGLVLILAFSEGYRAERMGNFMDPFEDPQGSGYQLIQSFYALGSGGWFGKGLNNSFQKLLYMTYGESDFIFPILVEEFGLMGGLTVIFGYTWIFARGMRAALRVRDRFGSLLAAGISIVLGVQVFINIAVITGLMPTTGQALPFISAGGTSMLVFMASMGVLLNITRDAEAYG